MVVWNISLSWTCIFFIFYQAYISSPLVFVLCLYMVLHTLFKSSHLWTFVQHFVYLKLEWKKGLRLVKLNTTYTVFYAFYIKMYFTLTLFSSSNSKVWYSVWKWQLNQPIFLWSYKPMFEFRAILNTTPLPIIDLWMQTFYTGIYLF